MKTGMKIKAIVALIILLMHSGFTFSQQIYRKMNFVKGNDSMPYRVLIPDNYDPNLKYPVIFFLHGSGERGNDNEKQLIHGADFFASAMKKYPAVVIFPQCPEEDSWASIDRTTSEVGKIKFEFLPENGPTKAMNLLMSLVDSIKNETWADQNRFYIGGLSMGGMGTFEILYRKPDVFAAAFTICGGGAPETTAAYATKVSLWIFHGLDDDIVPVSFSQKMAEALTANGGQPRLTLYPGLNHNSWDATFKEPGLLPWLFSNKK